MPRKKAFHTSGHACYDSNMVINACSRMGLRGWGIKNLVAGALDVRISIV